MKKRFNRSLQGILVAVVFLLVGIHTTQAATLSELQLLLSQLQAQLQVLKNSQIHPVVQTCVQLGQTLALGATDTNANGQVGKLQQFLRTEGYYTYPTLTGYYGPITKEAITLNVPASALSIFVASFSLLEKNQSIPSLPSIGEKYTALSLWK